SLRNRLYNRASPATGRAHLYGRPLNLGDPSGPTNTLSPSSPMLMDATALLLVGPTLVWSLNFVLSLLRTANDRGGRNPPVIGNSRSPNAITPPIATGTIPESTPLITFSLIVPVPGSKKT